MDSNSQFQQANQNLAGQLPQAPPFISLGYSPYSTPYEQSGVETATGFINSGTTAGMLATAGLYYAAPKLVDPFAWGRGGGGLGRQLLGGARGRAMPTLSAFNAAGGYSGFLGAPKGAAKWLGQAGFRAGTAAVGGTLAGVAGSMAVGAIAPAMIGSAVNSAIEGSRDYVTTRELARELQISPQGGSSWGRDSIFRQQTGPNFAQHLSRVNNYHLQDTIRGSAGHLGVSQSQMRNLTSSMGQAGMLDTSSVKGIRDSLREGLSELKELSKLVGLDLEEAMSTYKELEKLGFKDKVSRTRAMRRMAGVSQMSGLSIPAITEVMAAGRSLAEAGGTDQAAGGKLALDNLTAATTRIAMGDINEQYLQQVGGASGYAVRMTELQMGLQDSVFGIGALSQMFNPDGSPAAQRKGLLGMGKRGGIAMDRRFLAEADPYKFDEMGSKASPILGTLALYAVERARSGAKGSAAKNRAQHSFMAEQLGIEDATEQLEFLQSMRTRNYGAFSEAHQQLGTLGVEREMSEDAKKLKGIWGRLMETLGTTAKDLGEFVTRTTRVRNVQSGLRSVGADVGEFFSRNQAILAREGTGFRGSMSFDVSHDEIVAANDRFRDGTSSYLGLEGRSVLDAVNTWDGDHGGILRAGADYSIDRATRRDRSGGAIDRAYRWFARPKGRRRRPSWTSETTEGMSEADSLALSNRRIGRYGSNFVAQLGGHVGQDGVARFRDDGEPVDVLDRNQPRQVSALRQMVALADAAHAAGALRSEGTETAFSYLDDQFSGERDEAEYSLYRNKFTGRDKRLVQMTQGTSRQLNEMGGGELAGNEEQRLAQLAATRTIDPTSRGAQAVLSRIESQYGTDSPEYALAIHEITADESGDRGRESQALAVAAYARQSAEGTFSQLLGTSVGHNALPGGDSGLFGEGGLLEGITLGSERGKELTGQAAGMALGAAYGSYEDTAGWNRKDQSQLRALMRARLTHGHMGSVGGFVATAMERDENFDVLDYFGIESKDSDQYRAIQKAYSAFQSSGLQDLEVRGLASASSIMGEVAHLEDSIGSLGQLQGDAMGHAVRSAAHTKILGDRRGDTLRNMNDLDRSSLGTLATGALNSEGERGQRAIEAIKKIADGYDYDSLSGAERSLVDWGLGKVQETAGAGGLAASDQFNEAISRSLGIFSSGDAQDVLLSTVKSSVSDDGAIGDAVLNFGGEFATYASRVDNLRSGRSRDKAGDTEAWIREVMANSSSEQAEEIRQEILGYDTSGDGVSFTSKGLEVVYNSIFKEGGTLAGMDQAELHRMTLGGMAVNPSSPSARNKEQEEKLLRDNVSNIKTHLDSLVSHKSSIWVTDKQQKQHENPAAGSG